MLLNRIAEQLEALISLAQSVRNEDRYLASIENVINRCKKCLINGGRIITFGNGISATSALYLAKELTRRLRSNLQPMPAACLNAEASIVTGIADNLGYDQIFIRQIAQKCKAGDLVIAFSTDNKSAENVLPALRKAQDQGAAVIGIFGQNDGLVIEQCDTSFVVRHENIARIQEIHMFVIHAVCDELEKEFRTEMSQ